MYNKLNNSEYEQILTKVGKKYLPDELQSLSLH